MKCAKIIFSFDFLQPQKIRNFIIDHFPRKRTKIIMLSFDFCNRKNNAQLPGPYLQSSYWGQDYCPFTWARITAQLRVTVLLPSYRSQDYSPFTRTMITAQLSGPGLLSSYRRPYQVYLSLLLHHTDQIGATDQMWRARRTSELSNRRPGLLPAVTRAIITVQLPGPGLGWCLVCHSHSYK